MDLQNPLVCTKWIGSIITQQRCLINHGNTKNQTQESVVISGNATSANPYYFFIDLVKNDTQLWSYVPKFLLLQIHFYLSVPTLSTLVVCILLDKTLQNALAYSCLAAQAKPYPLTEGSFIWLRLSSLGAGRMHNTEVAFLLLTELPCFDSQCSSKFNLMALGFFDVAG